MSTTEDERSGLNLPQAESPRLVDLPSAEPRWTLRRRGGERRDRRRRQPAAARAAVRGVIGLQLAASLAGAVVVYVYLVMLFPVQLPDGELAKGLNIVVLGSYLFVTIIVAIPLNARVLNRAVAWIKEGRDPTEEERRDTLTQPIRQTVSAFLGWVGAAIIFGLLNDDSSRVSLGIAIAGVVTCSMLYLLLERHFRPVFAMALEGARLPSNRRDVLPKLMLAWGLGSALPLLALGLAPLVIPDEAIAFTWRVTVLVLSALVGGGLVMRAAAGSVSSPINRVRDALRKVEDGDLDVYVPVDDLGELGRLAEGFNSMVDGLRERAELFELLDKQVGSDVARHALDAKPQLGGERRNLTVLFVDLNAFTGFTESHSPEQVVGMLNRFFEVVEQAVSPEGGHINKFEGDAALCIFGAPTDQSDHAARGLRAARALVDLLNQTEDVPAAGIGVATGEAVAGYVGTERRYEYTVIGDAVNVASRLSNLAKESPLGVLATDLSVTSAHAFDYWQPAGSMQLRGRSATTDYFALRADGPRNTPDQDPDFERDSDSD